MREKNLCGSPVAAPMSSRRAYLHWPSREVPDG
jgi:hypothetical protein